MICYSLTGESTGLRLKEGLEKLGHSVQLWEKSKYLPDSIKESCSQWTGDRFGDSQAVIFIGACGIAVRSRTVVFPAASAFSITEITSSSVILALL